LAGLSYALALGWTVKEACVLANTCGGCAAGHIGVRVVNREEIIQELEA
jgi:bifunctional ADP-heptose synthase (sugar kinase/adenylyltransferase)